MRANIILLVAAMCFALSAAHWEPFLGRGFDRGYALRFDGSDVVDISSRNIPLGAPLTVEFLCKGRGAVFELSNTPNKEALRISIDPTFHVVVRVCGTAPSSCNTVTSTGTVAPGAWSYVAVTLAGTSQGTSQQFVSIYIDTTYSNAILRGGPTSVNPTLPLTTHSTGYIGRDSSGGWFTGDLDEIRVWSTVLPASSLHRDRTVRSTDTGLVAVWNFDDRSGVTALDSSSHGYHGSLGGGVNNRRPSWIVGAYVPASTCKIFNGHVRVFDRRGCYNLLEVGDYWVAQAAGLSVQGRFQAKERGGVALTGVAFQVGTDTVVFNLDFVNNRDATVTLNGRVQNDDHFELASGVTVVRDDDRGNAIVYNVDVAGSYKMRIVGYPRRQTSTLRLRAPDGKFSSVTGACGNFNGLSDAGDDVVFSTIDVTGRSFFPNSTFIPPVTGFTCTIAEPGLDFLAQSTCYDDPGPVSDSFQDQCYFDVCVSGDINAAYASAEATYDECLEDAANSNGDASACQPPCPNFCSFQGDCVAGTCQCYNDYAGADCSQLSNYRCYEASWGSGSVSVEPFFGPASVLTHYDYNDEHEFSSNTGNEVSQASVFYIYEQRPVAPAFPAPVPATTISLVVINDKFDDGSGGAATLHANLTTLAGASLSSPALSIARRDDSDDRYTNNGNDFKAVWDWQRCCTDGFALSGFPSDFCMTLDFTGLSGINRVYASGENNGLQELHAVPSTGLKICGKNCTNTCAQHTDCGSCMGDASGNCGWCEETGVCTRGGANGPTTGSCRRWRKTNSAGVSRTLASTYGFPVNPASVDAFLPSGGHTTEFFVTFPTAERTPLQVVLLQEVSNRWTSDLIGLKAGIVSIYRQLLRTFPSAFLGLASFSDKPVSPYGQASSGDYVFRLHLSPSRSTSAIQSAVNSLATAGGGDTANAQLEALLQLAVRTSEVGFGANTRRVVIVNSKSPYHTPVGGSFTPNNGDGVISNTEDYPSVAQLRSALLAANIVPIFMTTSDNAASYNTLVSQLGFGYVNTFSNNVQSLLANTLSSLNHLAGAARPLILSETGNVIDEIQPAAGYTGISAATRVSFNVLLNSGSGDAVVVVPGFGSFAVHGVGNDVPTAGTCPAQTISGAGSVPITISGGSLYNNALEATVTFPVGTLLFQSDGVTAVTSGSDVPLGTYLFDPNGQTGALQITYTVSDGCASAALVTCTVNAMNNNNAPVATPDSYLAPHDSPAVFTLQGSDPDGDTPLTFVVSQLPSNGDMFDGSTQVQPSQPLSGNTVTYRARNGACGRSDSFAFIVKDNRGGVSSAASCSVTISACPPNLSPTANSRSFSGDEDAGVITVTLSGADPENQPLTFTIDSLPVSSAGTLQTCATSGCPASTGVAASTTLYFAPASHFNGEASFTFHTNDGNSDSNTATITITVNSVDDAPVASGDTVLLDEDSVRFPVVLSASDIDSSSLVFTITSWSGQGYLYPTSSGSGFIIPGSAFVLPSNTVYYSPPANMNRDLMGLQSFSWSVTAGLLSASATTVLSVSPAEDAPYAVGPGQGNRNDPPQAGGAVPGTMSVSQNTPGSATLQGTDVDREQVELIICSLPQHGDLTDSTSQNLMTVGASVGGVTFSVDSTYGTVTYTPDFNFVGTDSFSFRARDAQLAESECAEVVVTVSFFSRPPVANDQSETVSEDAENLLVLSASDFELEPLTYTIKSVPSNGFLYVASTDGSATGDALGVGSSFFTPRLIYQTVLNYPFGGAGSDSFGWVASDGHSDSTTAVFSLTVNDVNDAPSATSASYTAIESDSASTTVTLSGSDIEQPVNIFFTVTSINCALGSLNGLTVNDVVSSVQYTPPTLGFGNNVCSFTFTATDNGVPAATSAAATIIFDVTHVNHAPSSFLASPSDFGNVNENTVSTTAVTLTAADPDTVDTLTITITSVSAGAVYVQGNSIPVDVTSNSLPNPVTLVYAAPDVAADTPVTITASVSDGHGGSLSTSFTATAVNVVIPPVVATTSTVSGDEDTLFTFTLAGADPQNPTDPLVVVFDSLPVSASFKVGAVDVAIATDYPINTVFSYQGPPNAFSFPVGSAYTSFVYFVANRVNPRVSDLQTVNVVLANVNDAPTVFMPETVSVPEDVGGIIYLGFSDVDLPLGSNFATIVTIPNVQSTGVLYRVNEDGTPGAALQAGDTVQFVSSTDLRFRVYFRAGPNVYSSYIDPSTGDLILLGATSQFRFTVTDNAGASATALTVGVFVSNSPDSPVAAPNTGSVSFNPNTAVAGPCPGEACDMTATINVANPDTFAAISTITFTSVNLPVGATTLLASTAHTGAIAVGTYGFSSPASLTVTKSNSGERGIPYATITYFVTDVRGTVSAPAQLNFDALYTNGLPIPVDGVTLQLNIETSPAGSSYLLDAPDADCNTFGSAFCPYIQFVLQTAPQHFALSWSAAYNDESGNPDYFQTGPIVLGEPFPIAPDFGMIQTTSQVTILMTPSSEILHYSGSDSFSFVTKDFFDTGDVVYTRSIIYTGENVAPTVAWASSSVTVAADAFLPALTIGDVGAPSDEVVTLVVTAPSSTVLVSNVAGVTGSNTNVLTFVGSIAFLNNAFITNPIWKSDATDITVGAVVTDAGGLASTQADVTVTFDSSQSNSPAPVAGALVGITSLMSLGMFGGYKIMKKKKLLPEDSDPWENDDAFNETDAHPIFSGAPTSSTALYAAE